jgi:hypothetical protein
MLRTAHGSAADRGRVLVVETTPHDELTAGTAAEPLPKVAPGHQARLLAGKPSAEDQRAAGLAAAAARAAQRELMRLGLPASSPLAPYAREAERWALAEVRRLARDVGGGQCPPNVAALVRSAAYAMAGSLLAYAQGDLGLAARLSTEQRQNVLAAHSLAALEAKARAASTPGTGSW